LSNVFFTSDLHLDETASKVVQLRGFSDPLDHAAVIAQRWAMHVGRRDEVWVLGDIATGSHRYALSVLRGLPGRKHLIVGNHDAVHPMHRRFFRHLEEFGGVFASVSMAGRRRIAGKDVLLSHFPYERDHSDPPRYRQWRLRNEGDWLLHGHTHGAEQATVRFPKEPRPAWDGEVLPAVAASREIHVGVDAWDLTPVPVDVIAGFIRTAP
jgi:calcineurin-like phosphoesterase family protein